MNPPSHHPPHLQLSREVIAARNGGKPVVALESTIISHGMPYPDNFETARAVEQVIRDAGATPATIGVLNGKIKIGLTEEELKTFATCDDIQKVSRRDLAYVVATGQNGGTTVAATMICAALADIRVFVTGGFGGVHRGGEQTLDVSADLLELARTDVAVVCAGAKSILDIGRTLEVLETHGVPVIGYRTDEFPAFYIRTSGHKVDFQLDSAEAIADFLHNKWQLGLTGGAVIANPVPAGDAMDEAEINTAIETAVAEAEGKNIHGKDVTPYLLDRIANLTNGASLKTNIALIKNNARLGAQIAVCFNAIH